MKNYLTLSSDQLFLGSSQYKLKNNFNRFVLNLCSDQATSRCERCLVAETEDDVLLFPKDISELHQSPSPICECGSATAGGGGFCQNLVSVSFIELNMAMH